MTDTTRGTTSDRASTGDGTASTGDETAYRATLGEVRHTNPYTDTAFGDTQTFSRGRTVAADGGEANTVTGGDDGSSTEDETLADVDHTPTGDVDGAQDSFDRGAETTSEPDDE